MSPTRPFRTASLLLSLAGALAAWPATAQEVERRLDPDYYTLSESIDVKLVTVPFYAVDKKGRPVYDLESDEIEVRIGGEVVEVTALDRFSAPAASRLEATENASEASGAAGGPPLDGLLAPTQPRHIFMLMDQAFSTPRGFGLNKQAAQRLVDELPPSDWVYLLTYHTQSGFEQRVGPVHADAQGKAALHAVLDELRPNIERLERHTEVQPIARGRREVGNVDTAYRDMHAIVKSEYRAAAGQLADSLESLASFMRQVQGPKMLLYFTQGIDSRLYTDGLSGRFPPIRLAFEKPLNMLAESGAMLLYVNPATHAEAGLGEGTIFSHEAEASQVNAVTTGETTLQEMSEVSGGKVLLNTNLDKLRDRMVDWTSAYYEVAVHRPGGVKSGEGEIEIRSNRKGVQVWTPKSVRTQRPYRDLQPREKQFMVADLVLHGPQARAVEMIDFGLFYRLDGEFSGSVTEGLRHLHFDALWPKEVQLRQLDVYSVVVRPPTPGGEASMVRFDLQRYTPSSPNSKMRVAVDPEGEQIWGVVAIEPLDGSIYVRRMFVHPTAAVATKAAADGGQDGGR